MARYVGKAGSDVYSGTADDDQIGGGEGNDRLFGFGGADLINGGAGDDVLSSNGYISSFAATFADPDIDADRVIGGEGNDIIAGGWNDRLEGGVGTDVLFLDLRGADQGVSLDIGRLASGRTIRNGTGLLSGFEGYAAILLTSFDDDILVGGMKNYGVLGGGIYGGDGNDRINAGTFGSGGGNQIYAASLNGGNGDDTIIGSSGSDSLRGDAGNDRLTAGDGNDVVYGGDGDDVIDLRGFGSDYVVGGSGADGVILSGTRADWFTTLDFREAGMFINLTREQLQPNGASARTVQVSETEYFRFDDGLMTERSLLAGFVIGSDQDDSLVPGQAGRYGLSATGGSDTLYGLGGDDVLDGGAGADLYYGGEGSDTFVLRDRDRIMDLEDGELIRSWVDYAGASNYAVVRIELMGADDLNASDPVASAIIGNAGNNHLTGRGLLAGGAGDDVLENAGEATVSYADADRGVVVKLGVDGPQDTVGAGHDTLIGITRLIGSDHADVLVGGAGNDTIEGGAGNDRLWGSDPSSDFSHDIVSYAMATGGVTVSLAVGGAQDTIGAGVDTISRFEGVIGSAFGDRLSGGARDDTLRGGAGGDHLRGGGGQDTIDGGDGDDVIDGGAAGDATTGGSGADRFVFDATLLQNTNRTGLETVGDYNQSEGDVIDLTALDANLAIEGDQAFVRVDAFTGQAGELTVRRAGDDYWTTIVGDVDGDGRADFAILVHNQGASPDAISLLL